jgi:hypothetical protein
MVKIHNCSVTNLPFWISSGAFFSMPYALLLPQLLYLGSSLPFLLVGLQLNTGLLIGISIGDCLTGGGEGIEGGNLVMGL